MGVRCRGQAPPDGVGRERSRVWASSIRAERSQCIFFALRSVEHFEADIYARIRNWYFPAKLGAPGDADVPALVFQSRHGHSHLIISQTSVSLNVVYSPDWQSRVDALRDYVVGRTELLLEVATIIAQDAPSFCGSVTRVHVPWKASDEELVAFVARMFAGGQPEEVYHDANVKLTSIVDDLFFSNVTIQNYRSWNLALPIASVFRLSRQRAAERGVEVIVDFNSRYAFNEDKAFKVTRDSTIQLINRNLEIVDRTITRIVGGQEG